MPDDSWIKSFIIAKETGRQGTVLCLLKVRRQGTKNRPLSPMQPGRLAGLFFMWSVRWSVMRDPDS